MFGQMEDLKAPGEKTQRKQKVHKQPHKPSKQNCVDRDVSVCDRSVRITLNKILLTFKKFKGKVDC